MPRTARTIAADICYHVLNRGNGRSRVFHDDDFREFLTLSRRAAIDAEVDILAYCLMKLSTRMAQKFALQVKAPVVGLM